MDEDSRQTLHDDIVLLIKASGEQLPIMIDDTTSLLDILQNIAESTSQAKMMLGEPNPCDLGLLQNKVQYS